VQAGGLLAAFGSDAKALQVGLASAAGVRAALLAANGASAPAGVRVGFQAAYGATWAGPDPGRPSIRENWIKAYPCCLQTHSAIEAAELARTQGLLGSPIVVRVHPISLQAASYPRATTPLEAKFSIPYMVAFTLRHGPPRVEDFRSLDPEATELSAHIEAVPDEQLSQSEAVLEAPGLDPIRVEAALGSPGRPMDPDGLGAKVASLAGEALEGLLSDDVPARAVIEFLSEARVTGSQRGPGSRQ
jgi:2-methylcitrate dehydratase PrpD